LKLKDPASIEAPQASFHQSLLIGCRSIEKSKFLFLGLWGRTKHMLLRKGFHQVKVKYGSNQLAKSWGRRWIELHCFFVYCQHMIELNNLLKLRTLDVHVYFQFHFDSGKM